MLNSQRVMFITSTEETALNGRNAKKLTISSDQNHRAIILLRSTSHHKLPYFDHQCVVHPPFVVKKSFRFNILTVNACQHHSAPAINTTSTYFNHYILLDPNPPYFSHLSIPFRTAINKRIDK